MRLFLGDNEASFIFSFSNFKLKSFQPFSVVPLNNPYGCFTILYGEMKNLGSNLFLKLAVGKNPYAHTPYFFFLFHLGYLWEGKGGYTPEICFSRSPNECSRSQNINCLNRCDFYSRTTKYFRLNTHEIIIQRISAVLMYHRLICESV